MLDDLWEATQGESADFYKGLIQASICLHHLQGGNPDGARKLYTGHRKLLAGYLPAHLGLDVQGFLAEMQRSLSPVIRSRPGEEPGFDFDARPRIELTNEP